VGVCHGGHWISNFCETQGVRTLRPSEQVEVDRRLASAYATDESAAKNDSIERISGKIQAHLSFSADDAVDQLGEQEPTSSL
jgi:hypothetical protein